MAKPLNEQKLSHKVETHPTSSLRDEFTRLRDTVMQRAYDIFCQRPAELADPLDDWLAAERELVWQPQMTVAETAEGRVDSYAPDAFKYTITAREIKG